MTRLEIEPWSPGPLVNIYIYVYPIDIMIRVYIYSIYIESIYIYIYIYIYYIFNRSQGNQRTSFNCTPFKHNKFGT